MSRNYHSSLYRVIDDAREHFWFKARSRLIVSLLKKHFPDSQKPHLLDAGCGNGTVIRALEKAGIKVTGVDINQKALQYARTDTKARLVRKSFFGLKPVKGINAIGMFDVLEHQGDDGRFIRKAYEMLPMDGLLFVNVPAGPMFFTKIDELAGHHRRYTRKDLVNLVKGYGFNIKSAQYWQFLTLPFFVSGLLLWKISKSGDIGEFIKTPSGFVNRLLYTILVLEQALMKIVDFPYGASLILVARKG